MQDHATHELDIEVAHAQGALAGFTANGEGFDEQVVEGGAVVELLFELGGFGFELFVGELLDGGFEVVDGGDAGSHSTDGAVVRGAEELLQGPAEHAGFLVLMKRSEGQGGVTATGIRRPGRRKS